MKKKLNIKKIGFGILILVIFLLVTFLLCYSEYYRKKQNTIVLKTQYTFSVRIDSNGNVIDDDDSIQNSDESTNNTNFGNIDLNQIAQIWIEQFTNQFEQKFVPRLKAVSNIDITKIQVLNADENNVFIAFDCEPRSNVTDYFSSWNGYMSEGKMVCEWVIQFEIQDLNDNTARIFAKSIQLPEDYGLARSKATTENITKAVAADSKNASGSNLYTYQIKNEKLAVTFDGGDKWNTVPIDIGNLNIDKNDKTTLLPGSYQVGLEKSAFIYGGNTVAGKIIPLTIIYSDDKGTNWTSASITDLVGIDYYYVKFINQKEGFVTVAYNKMDNIESCLILKTTNGGESWTKVGNGPINSIVRSVNFIDSSTGYIDYEYMDGMESNLYVTNDGGQSFSPVILGDQQFEDANTKLSWNSVYKDVQIPTQDDDGVLTLVVTQGNYGDYNGGDTVAKYQSTDSGHTWKYVGEQ